MTRLDETNTANECNPSSSLYQVETCIQVTPRTGSSHVGHVVSCSSSDVVVVAVENQLMLCSASNRQLVSALSFESQVDSVACNSDGSLLVVGERCGDIHAVNAVTGEQLASQQLETKRSDDMSLFTAIEFGGESQSRLAVLTSVGHLHVIDGLQTQQLKHSIITITDALLCLTVLSDGDILTGNADGSLSLWSNDPDGQFSVVSSCPMLFGTAVKCASLSSDSLSIVLDSSGRLVVWNLSQFVATSMVDCEDVVDFVLVDRPVDSRQSVGTIASLQKSQDTSAITVYSVPRTQLIYSVNVHSGALLFPSSMMNDSVYFLEMWTENASSNPANVTSSWQIRRLAETDPQTRLRRLLAKQCFSEAESFAKKFDLDVQFVYRECVLHLMAKLSSSVADVDASASVSELLKCLRQLNDVPFVVECCVTTALPTLAATSELVSLAYERLKKSQSLSAECRASLDLQLEEMSRRLAAFQVTLLLLLPLL